MLPVNPVLDFVTTEVGIADIIDAYNSEPPNYALALQKLTFNDQGECTSPEVVAMAGKVVTSPDCDLQIKNGTLSNFEGHPELLRAEIEKAANDGYAIYLTDTRSNKLDVSGIDFSGGKFVADGATFDNFNANGTNFTGGSVSDVVIYSGDLSGSVMEKMTCNNFLSLNATQTNTKGMVVDPAADAGILRS